jgi:hypothetical protein
MAPIDLTALDGGTFTYEGTSLNLDAVTAVSTAVSGAWLDGEQGFVQLFSGPLDHCAGTIESVLSGRVEETYTRRDGVLAVGTFTQYDQHDFRVIAHCSFAYLAGRTLGVWGYNDTSPAAIAEYFDTIAVHETASGVAVAPANGGRWDFQKAASDLVHTVPDVAIHSLQAIEEPPPAALLRGRRTRAGSLLRSDRVDPKLFLTTNQVKLQAVPLAPRHVDRTTRLLAAIETLSYTPGPAS